MNFNLDELLENDFDFEESQDKYQKKLSDITINDEFLEIEHELEDYHVFYENAKEIAKKIKLKRNSCIFIMLSGKFIFGDFIGSFIQENNLYLNELTIESLSGSVDIFELLEALIDNNWVSKINLRLSGYYLRTETKKRTKSIILLEEIAKRKKGVFNISYTNTHRKIILMQTDTEAHICMHGSANLKSSQSLEHLYIQENKKLYNFLYNNFINEQLKQQ